MVKIELYLPHEELLDGMNRRPSSSIHRAVTWRQRTPTAAAERTMSAAGVRTVVGEVAAAKRFVAGVVAS